MSPHLVSVMPLLGLPHCHSLRCSLVLKLGVNDVIFRSGRLPVKGLWRSWLNEWVAICFRWHLCNKLWQADKSGLFWLSLLLYVTVLSPGSPEVQMSFVFNKMWMSVRSCCCSRNRYSALTENLRQEPSQPESFVTVSLCSQQKASGKVLLDLVCSHMNLVEGDYFGLEFQNHQKIMVR